MKVLGLLLLAATVARAGEGPLEGFSPVESKEARASLEAVHGLGLADTVTGDRIREWSLKGASPARILELLGSWRGAVADAATVLRQVQQPLESARLEAVAEARMAGFTPAQLASSLQGAGSLGETTARCLALSTMALTGYARDGVAQAVREAVQSGYRGADFDILVAAARRLASENVASRPLLLEEVQRALQGKVQPKDLYPAVLRSVGAEGVRPRKLTPESGFNHPVFRKTLHP